MTPCCRSPSGFRLLDLPLWVCLWICLFGSVSGSASLDLSLDLPLWVCPWICLFGSVSGSASLGLSLGAVRAFDSCDVVLRWIGEKPTLKRDSTRDVGPCT